MSIDCNEEWESFCLNNSDYISDNIVDRCENKTKIPKCGDIYISTKTIISYLSKELDIHNIFWKIPVIDYGDPKCGVIKKQMKISFTTKEDVTKYKSKINNYKVIDEHIISQIDSDTKYKDVRKISIGLCKKDILNNRCKKKSAFYNCFVLIFRIKYEGKFKEAHVKVFNTGKLEIPGVQSNKFISIVLNSLVDILNTHCELNVTFKKECNETVLINSNFNCGFYLNREKFYDLLKYKYNIHSSYDPCSYPGIMCKFYYNLDGSGEQNGIFKNFDNYLTVSFMIFRTGSVLIVGKCDEEILTKIYEYLKSIIQNEYDQIYQPHLAVDKKKVVKKIRKKIITINL